MGEVSTSVQEILEYTELAIARRFGNLPMEERERMDALETRLRDLIKGARPAPRSIEGRRAAPSTPAPPRAPAAAPAQPPKLSDADRKKVSEVDASEIAPSEYTAPLAPPFLADYYASGVVLASADEQGPPTAAVVADGSEPELRPEVRVLLGLEGGGVVAPPSAKPVAQPSVKPVAQPSVKPVVQPSVQSVAQPSVKPVAAQAAAKPSSRIPTNDLSADLTTPAPAPRRAEPAAPAGRPSGRRSVNVHLATGGLRKGHVDAFDESSEVLILVEEGKGESTIPLGDILAIAFGPAPGMQPSPPQGTRAVVRLVNGRQVSGLTSDYQEGATHLTLSPEERRGSIDYIWIPASAVREIHLG